MSLSSGEQSLWEHAMREMSGTSLETVDEVEHQTLYVDEIPGSGLDLLIAITDERNGLMDNEEELRRAVEFVHALDAHNDAREIIANLPVEEDGDGYIISLQFPDFGSDEVVDE